MASLVIHAEPPLWGGRASMKCLDASSSDGMAFLQQLLSQEPARLKQEDFLKGKVGTVSCARQGMW